jgi:hypothetical protein
VVALRSYSFSQVDNFLKCQRYWSIVKLEGVELPPAKFQARGTAIHNDAEHYALTQEIRSEYIQAAVVGGFLPAPNELPHAGYRVEYPFQVTIGDGIIFKGFVDAIDMRQSPVEIIDYKSTSDFRYCKTEEEIADNLQLLTYARIFEQEEVKLSHVYFLTKGKPKVKKVSALAAPAKVNEAWDRTLTTIHAMELVRGSWTSAENVAPTGADTGHCKAYGGCPFQRRCGFAPSWKEIVSKFSNKESNDNMDPKTNPIIEKLKLMKARQDAARQDAVPAAEASSPVAAPTPTPEPAPAVLPPDAAPRDALAAPAPVAAPIKRGPGRPPKVRPAESPAPVAVPVAAVVEPEEPAEVTENLVPIELVNKYRADYEALAKSFQSEKARADELAGKVKAAELDHTATRAKLTDTEMALAEAMGMLENAPTQTASAPGFTLYIDCWPTKGDGLQETFEEWAEPALAEAAKIGEVPDAGLIDYKSKGVIAGCLRELVAKGLPESLVVSSRSRWYDVICEILIPRAKKIVKGSW